MKTTAFLLVGLLLFATTSHAADKQPASSSDDNVRRLTETIDEYLANRWTAEKVTPAPPADDAEFMRRVYLDIAGSIPPVSEARTFLEDKSRDKRRKLVERLLGGPGYIVQFGNMWRQVMMPEAMGDLQVRYLLPGFEAWIRQNLIDDVGYDKMVYDLLTTPLSGANPYGGTPSPVAFFQAKQTKPENLAASTSRMFLGLRIECAQCHDHPFDNWQRKQFWGYAAFFAGIERERAAAGFLAQLQEFFTRRTLTIPGTKQTVAATYLDGKPAVLSRGETARLRLAEWITNANNPYFARAAANRMWGHFFGIGIVDPVDNFSSANPPSHPELLDELAAGLRANRFDMKFLIRSITSSRAYQLTSRKTDESQKNPRLFARMAIKGLTAEQLFDSVAQATGYYDERPVQIGFVFDNGSAKSTFMESFRNSADAPTDRHMSVLQALAMMNGSFTADATSLGRSRTLAAVADFPQFNTQQRLETLFLAALCRKPVPKERTRMVEYIDGGGSSKDSKRALSDVFWALLNSSEFMFNH